MAVAFSSSDEDVIKRQLQVTCSPEQSDCWEETCELSRCKDWIQEHGYNKVALQFPDCLLKFSVVVAQNLKKETQKEIFILGDTSYGSCCVDEIAAEHVSADAIIHFGHACLSPTNRLPVLYVFGRFPIDVDRFVKQFQRHFVDPTSPVIVFSHVYYTHAIESIQKQLNSTYSAIIFARCSQKSVETPNSDLENLTCIRKCGQELYLPKNSDLSTYDVLYIGCEEQAIMNLMLSFNTSKFYAYNPIVDLLKRETLDTNKYIMKRYYYIEKAKDAKIIGILVGTLGVSNYLSIINHLKELAKLAGKKSYTLVVGKLNLAKLANFPEVDVFVYVSCPESIFIDNRDFYQPIITPYELEIACNQARTWTGDYVTDFSQLLPGASSHVPFAQQQVSDVSLLTGKCRTLYIDSENDDDSVDTLAVRDDMTISTIHENAAGEHLAGRHWQGLERHLGETPVSKAIDGMKGIALTYEGEGT